MVQAGWVVQEVGLSSKARILYGTYELDWSVVMRVTALLVAKAVPLVTACSISGTTEHNMWQSYDVANRDPYRILKPGSLSEEKRILVHLRYARERLEASDKRDMVYAFLPHFGSGLLIQPDYTKSVREIYIEFVVAWLQRSRTAHILSNVSHGNALTAELDQKHFPTWCPRWDKPDGIKLAELLDDEHNASLSQDFQFEIVDEIKLRVHGMTVDTISFVSPILRRRHFRSDKCVELDLAEKGSIAEILSQALHRGTLNEQMYEEPILAFATTLVQGANRISPYEILHAFITYLVEMTDGDPARAVPGLEDVLFNLGEGVSSEIFRSLGQMRARRKRFVVTEKGYFGLAPAASEEGDICCVFLGTQIPFVIRPAGLSKFNFVGSCYVQGFMDGEAITMVGQNQLQLNTFTLLWFIAMLLRAILEFEANNLAR